MSLDKLSFSVDMYYLFTKMRNKSLLVIYVCWPHQNFIPKIYLLLDLLLKIIVRIFSVEIADEANIFKNTINKVRLGVITELIAHRLQIYYCKWCGRAVKLMRESASRDILPAEPAREQHSSDVARWSDTPIALSFALGFIQREGEM